MRVLIVILLGASLGGCALSAGYSVTKFEYREPPTDDVVYDDEAGPRRPADGTLRRHRAPTRADDGR